MQRFTVEKSFSFDVSIPSRALIIKANGGVLTVAVYSGTEWVVADTFTEDNVVEYFTAGMYLKFTPTGGAVYALDDSKGVK